MKVIAALDVSDHSEAALKSIASRPWSAGTEITLISVIDLGLYDHEGWNANNIINLNQLNKKLVAERTQYLDLAVDKLKKKLPQCKIERRVLQGRAREGILNDAKHFEPDLLIMGSHGHTGVKRMLLGSVAESVMINAVCPVEIVKIASYEVENEPIGAMER